MIYTDVKIPSNLKKKFKLEEKRRENIQGVRGLGAYLSFPQKHIF